MCFNFFRKIILSVIPLLLTACLGVGQGHYFVQELGEREQTLVFIDTSFGEDESYTRSVVFDESVACDMIDCDNVRLAHISVEEGFDVWFGNTEASIESIIQDVQEHGSVVYNVSIGLDLSESSGRYFFTERESESLAMRCERLATTNAVFVLGAGNDFDDPIYIPQCAQETGRVLLVAGIDKFGRPHPSSSTCRGAEAICVYAPFTSRILGLLGGIFKWDGASGSASIVSAILLQIMEEYNLDAPEAAQVLLECSAQMPGYGQPGIGRAIATMPDPRQCALLQH